jgi:PKD repeat protein
MFTSNFFAKAATILIVTFSSVQPALAIAQNDNFAEADAIISLPFDDTVSLVLTSTESGEPIPSCTSIIEHTVWYTYTPTTSGLVALSVSTPVFVVYSGNTLSGLTEMGCTDNSETVIFHADANTTYYFQVGNADFTTPDAINVHVEVPILKANFDISPLDPSVFDIIQFSDLSSDPEGVGIQSYSWNFGDGTTSTAQNLTHQYAQDRDYTVQLTVTTPDSRTASTSKIVHIETHDVAITKIPAPSSANVGQTKSITVYVYNKRYPETVEVKLYKSDLSDPSGFSLLGSYTGQMSSR